MHALVAQHAHGGVRALTRLATARSRRRVRAGTQAREADGRIEHGDLALRGPVVRLDPVDRDHDLLGHAELLLDAIEHLRVGRDDALAVRDALRVGHACEFVPPVRGLAGLHEQGLAHAVVVVRVRRELLELLARERLARVVRLACQVLHAGLEALRRQGLVQVDGLLCARRDGEQRGDKGRAEEGERSGSHGAAQYRKAAPAVGAGGPEAAQDAPSAYRSELSRCCPRSCPSRQNGSGRPRFCV